VVARGLQTLRNNAEGRLWRRLATKPLQIRPLFTRPFSKHPYRAIQRAEKIRSISYRYGGTSPQKSIHKFLTFLDLAFSDIFGRFFVRGPPPTKCLKGSPYLKNVLANVVGHLKLSWVAWFYFWNFFHIPAPGCLKVFRTLKFRPTWLNFVSAFLQTSRIRSPNGKCYRKTLPGLFVGLVKAIGGGQFLSQNIW